MPTRDAWQSIATALLGEPELTADEVAAAAGIDRAQASRVWQALGFAPVGGEDRVFTRRDAEVLGVLSALSGERGLEPAVVLQLTRIVGQSLARIADAQVAAAAESTPGPEPLLAVADSMQAMAGILEPLLTFAWRRHLMAAVLRHATAEDRAPGGDREIVVGFADLVGFTAYSQQHDATEIAAMVDRFEATAYEHVVDRGGRVVKIVGDEVMFAVERVDAAAEMALGLVRVCAEDPALPDLRVGLALGPIVPWGGDLFGPTVNLASRLVNIARPGTVLVSEEFGRAMQDRPEVSLRHLRALPLKGLGRVQAWVLRAAVAKRVAADR